MEFWIAFSILVVFAYYSLAIQAHSFSNNEINSAEYYFDLAKKLIVQDDINEALQNMELAVQVDSGNYLARFKRAAILLQLGKNNQALSDLNLVISQKPDFDQALLQRAKINLRSCELEQAKSDLEPLLKGVHKSEAEQLLDELKQAQSLLAHFAASKDINVQLQQLNTLTNICSQDGQLRMKRAEIYESMGDFLLASGEYGRAATLIPDNIPAYQKIAQMYLRLGDIDQALAGIKGCLHLDPEHRECGKLFKKLKKTTRAMEKAKEYISKGRFRDALGADALDSDKTSKNGLLVILEELSIKGQVETESHKLICECYSKLKRTSDALKWCELVSDDADTLCNLGDAQLSQDLFEEAVKSFSKAHEISGGSQRSREGLQKAQRLLKQSKKKDYYKILGISRDASDKEIRKAYRKQALEYHPDKFTDKKKAEAKMAEINQAYEVLSNEELKQRYDDTGDDPNDPTGGGQDQFHRGGHGGGPIFFHQGSGFPGGGGFEFNFKF